VRDRVVCGDPFLIYCFRIKCLESKGGPDFYPDRLLGREVMPLPKEDKIRLVESLEQQIRESCALLLTDYRGLSVAEITTLRRKLQESTAEYKVVKNTLFKRAAEQAQIPDLGAMLEGPTAMVFVRGDAVTTARTLYEFIKEFKIPVVKGGYVEGQVLPAEQIEQLAKIPPRPVLYSQMLGAMQSPIVGLVSTLQGMISNLVYTLQAVAEKKAA